MVRLREAIIIKDPSLLNEKLGPFKIRKILPLALGGMLGYGMIRKGTVDDIIIGVIIIIASLIISFGPDRSLSFENLLQAMLYFYTLKTKGVKVQPAMGTPSMGVATSGNNPNTSSEGTTTIQPAPIINLEELELKISELKQKIKDEKDIIKRLKIRRELLSYELQYYTAEINEVEQKIQQLKTKMKSADKNTKNKISKKLGDLNNKRSELYKMKKKIDAELKKFEKVVLIENEEINGLKKKIEELKSQIKSTTDKKKLKELKRQYKSTLLDYYNKKILQDEAILKLSNDKMLKEKINAELKELYKKKKELEKKSKNKSGLFRW